MSDTENTEVDHDEPAIQPPESGEVSGDVGGHDEAPYRRTVSDKTRKLFEGAAKSLSEQIADGGADDYVPAIESTNAQSVAAAPPLASDGAPPAAGGTPAAAAAPALNLGDGRKGLELDVREKAIADREAKLVDREERANKLATARERYFDKPADLLTDLLKEWTGASTDDELRDEVADLITELSEKKLGLPVGSDVKSRTEARRALRIAKSYKDEANRKETELKKQSEDQRVSAEQQARERTAVDALGSHLKAIGDKYPHLMLEDSPHEIVWDLIKEQRRRSPDPEAFVPNLGEALDLANTHFKAQHDKVRQKLSRLPTPATQVPAVGAQHQGAAQGHAARTLTNASTAPTAPAQPVSDDEPYDREKARRRSLGRLQGQLKERTT